MNKIEAIPINEVNEYIANSIRSIFEDEQLHKTLLRELLSFGLYCKLRTKYNPTTTDYKNYCIDTGSELNPVTLMTSAIKNGLSIADMDYNKYVFEIKT